MKKHLTSFLVIIGLAIVVIGVVGIIKASKSGTPAAAPSPVSSSTQPVKLCFYGESKTPSGLSDVSLATLDISGGQVTGSFKYLPAEKDSKTGSFSGTVGPVDKVAMARTADVTWNVSAEGMTSQEQLKIMFGEGTAQAGFGEMVQGADGVWNYKDAAALTYGQAMTDVSCDDVRIAEHADGRMCYAYHQEATATAPYAVDERLDLTATNALVSGTKTGTQNGPDMTNGYTGSISGTRSGDTIHSVYAYTIEGSKNSEAEIYKYVAGGLQKLRYPLVSKKGILTPDTTKPSKAMDYSAVDCSTVPGGQKPSAKLPAGSVPPPPVSSVTGIKWTWQKTVMSDGTVVVPKKKGAFSITLGSDGKAHGTTDCNGFGGSYQVGSDGIITFGPLASTLMYCDGSQESVFTGYLSNVSHMMTDASGNLVLLLKFDSGSVIFAKG